MPAQRTEESTRRAAPEGGGVTFPEIEGRRSTTPTARGILADAARPVDPDLADRIAATGDWRGGYTSLVRELTAACAASARAGLDVAEAGLASMRERMVFERAGGDVPVADSLEAAQPGFLATSTVQGKGTRTSELRVPYRGRELRGSELLEQAGDWVDRGVVQPRVAEALGTVIDHPEWLALEGRRVLVLGAASEMGPFPALSAWGAHVIAVDLPQPDTSARVAAVANEGAGTTTLPRGPDGALGVDVLRFLPELRAWLDEAAGDDELVLGMYAYADGGLHVRLSAAFDALAWDLLARRERTAIAGLATPTDAYVAPPEVIEPARAARKKRGRSWRAVAQAPLRGLSAGRLYVPSYAGNDAAPVADSLVQQQGPNYAVAKRLQRWCASVAAAQGHLVSFNVAPPSLTRSVTKNRILAAAYAGSRHFDIEIFAPETSRVLMAALLVHDLHQPPQPERHPEALFTDCASHGGLWARAYEPRSVLGIAALSGLPETFLGGKSGAR